MMHHLEAPSAQRPTVLIVDDEPLLRRSVAAALARAFRVLQAGSYGEATALVSAPGACDLLAVVSDFDLGSGPDGLELLAFIRADAPRCRRLLLSGSISDRIDAAVASGLVEKFVAKPYESRELLAAVQGLVGERAAPLAN